MKNLRKLEKKVLKTIKGGGYIPDIPLGCIEWDFKSRCCLEWDWQYPDNRTC
ncbi:hypothetical protein QWZ06_06500 [Chryseobacterium tructae]|uniref:Bacteriocin n=1 Tax=Chryseobacterium tructae TaxID=1037380 RepID=A0ABV7XTS3_9FLAO|nr:hypothetical protein [Chryseobacterium tructae]MDN3691927.1 hypothetical protein [Chryseobacterium tructae]